MKKLIFLLLLFPSFVSAKEAWRDWCMMGNRNVTTSGINSTTKVQQSFPQCTVTIYDHGGGLATIYSDNAGTPLANPFVSQTDGQFIWYAQNGRYDQTTTSAGMPQAITMSDILLCDPADAAGGSCGTATGGSGCVLSGVDTGIVTEHPVGTCFDSIDATWDHTAFNLQYVGGFGAAQPNTVGTDNTFMFGAANNMSGESWEYALGDNNDLRAGIGVFSEIYALGDSNTVRNVSFTNATTAVIGFSNIIGDAGTANSGGRTNFVLGGINSVYGGEFVTVLNYSNQVGTPSGGGLVEFGVVSGYLNQVNTLTGASSMANIGIYGDSNSIDGIADGTCNDCYIYGFTNHADKASDSYIYGLDNFSLGPSVGDITIFGASNHSTTTVAGPLGASDSTIVGFLNLQTSVGNGFTAGGANTMASCTVCAQIGFNMTSAASNSVHIGVSATPEVIITANTAALPKVVTISATAFTNLGTPANGTFKYCNDCTIANPCASGGSGAFAKRLNNAWVCN